MRLLTVGMQTLQVAIVAGNCRYGSATNNINLMT